MPKRMRKYNFPCLECGPIKWLPTIVGHICPTCQGDADDSDPTEECSVCHGYVPEPEPFTHWTIIGPVDRCLRCDGAGRLKKGHILQAEFEASLTDEQRAAFAEAGKKLRASLNLKESLDA